MIRTLLISLLLLFSFTASASNVDHEKVRDYHYEMCEVMGVKECPIVRFGHLNKGTLALWHSGGHITYDIWKIRSYKGVVVHELAHQISWELYGDPHKNFHKICKKHGGSGCWQH